MDRLSTHDGTTILLSVGVLLAVARLLGELAKRYHQPAVLGEILAGVLLGPTVLGAIAPGVNQWLFPATGPVAVVLDGISLLAVTLFLLVAGMEVDLSAVYRQGRAAAWISLVGMVAPFVLGYALAWFFPATLGSAPDANPWVFALFLGTALAISALPVIARTLMDLNLFRTDFGMLVVAAAIVQDLAGWIIFAVVIGMMGAGAHQLPVGTTIALVILFTAWMLTAGKWLLNRVLPWVQARASWPGGVLGLTATLALLCAALTDRIGVHGIFGSFLFGVAIGDSKHMRERVRATLEQFVSFIFAPLFFATIGLKVNFITHFDAVLVLVILAVASVGKLVGAGLGARLGGLSKREALAVGHAMNARGAMEIILGLLALEAGIIREPLFVALVIMALATSVVSGPLIMRALQLKKLKRFVEFLSPKHFIFELQARTSEQAIGELAGKLNGALSLQPDQVVAAVLRREAMMPTGLEHGIAVPHARVDAITSAIVLVGMSRRGIDFDSTDGSAARLIFLILTPENDPQVQLEIVADIAGTFSNMEVTEHALASTTFTEFVAVVRTAQLPAEPRRA